MSDALFLATAEIGAHLPARRHRIDQALINRYAEISGDYNPLHLDPAFAATTPFGRTIAHGMMTLAFLSAAMRLWAGPSWLSSGSLDITFLAPVFPDSLVTIAGEVIRRDGETIICNVTCHAEDKLIAAGETSVHMGDARHG